ncbi:hypothetical protein AARAC_007694 [Aspergillus arachidicola]|uniref:PD-(D/E)XK nuclease-like domain-containing protein n=1 Tax=Aspergillus arachidicola TaxID=656916 RepID=A0A2G7FT67_9EURO|nr:hypothetical protein AARAC_007694 [Aspergillus arachidicola]
MSQAGCSYLFKKAGLQGGMAKISEEDSQGAVDVSDPAWDHTTQWTSGKLEAVWEDVVGIHKEAAECEELGQNENAWATGVILQILERGLKGYPTLQIKNVQMQTIGPSLLPQTPSQVQVNKKLDTAPKM